jgi:hypothetical protein
MPEGEEPIIVRPGDYPDPRPGFDNIKGICLIVDDKNSWTIETSETPDGKSFTHITIPNDSNWMVVHDELPLTDNTTFRRVALVRRGGTIKNIGEANSKGEREIDYTLLPPEQPA